MSIIKHQRAVFEKNKLLISNSITIDEWKELGQALRQVEGSVQFWIGDWARFGDKKGFTGKLVDTKVYDELEEITGLDRGTLQNYKSVAERVEPSLRNESLSFNHHVEVAKLPPEKQEQFLSNASEEKLSVRDLRAEIRKEKFKDNIIMPTDKYRILYVDPPWQYNDKQDTPMLGGAQKHYPTMTIQELCSMPLPETEDNAVLFMWVTSPLLEECFDIINAWGFKYKSSFVWDKIGHNMGHYNSVRHELLLVCTKGSCTPENVKLFDSVQSIEKTDKHSEKPEEFRQIIDTLYPSGKRIELFARVKHEGWDAYGNEV
jgi:N6-adenosine-specific RNA methylase IME4